jgi:spermidine synthase
MKSVLCLDTGFQLVEVHQTALEVEFRVQGAIHAWWHQHRFLTGLAWDCLAASALLRATGPPRSLLMLGVAGGTSLRVLRHLLPDLQITAVDIDPGIIELGRQYMGLDELGAEIHIADAYEWLWHNERQFDVVIDDVYRAAPDDVERPGAINRVRAEGLRRALAPGGVLAANLVIGQGHRRMQSAFRAFFREEFQRVRSITTPASANEMLVGGDLVLTGRALRPWANQFPHPRDQAFWEAMRVKSL